MIVLDANVLIAHLDTTDIHHDRAGALLEAVADQALRASPITLAEVLAGPARARQLDRATVALGRLGVVIVDLGEGAPVRLALLRAGTNLKLPDCCVLMAAEQVQGAVATFDDRLARAASSRGLTLVGT